MALATIILDKGGGRPQLPKQKTFRLRQNGEWRHPQIPPENGSGTGLILLLDGEVGPTPAGPDEHSQTGILTSGLRPHSRLPGLASAKPVAVGVCSP